LNLRTAVPAGNSPCAEFLFEPIVGNCHHWELGAGLTSHVQFCVDSCNSFGLYLDANITHLFASQSRRSFEFLGHGPGSRYMLIETIRPESTDLFLGSSGGPAAPNQYNQVVVPAINRTTFRTTIGIPCQADVVLKASFIHNNFEFDIGYNFWGRSAEKLQCRDRLDGFFACKGDAQLYGFTASDAPVPLNATESKATLYGGQGASNFVAGDQFQNLNVDSPINAYSSAGALQQLTSTDAATLSIPQAVVNTSNPAVLLTDADINNASALSPKAITHKLFFYMNSRWESDKVTPYIGWGGMVEFAQKTFFNKRGAFSQWGFVFKGGLSY
jgi:hypothetical protein